MTSYFEEKELTGQHLTAFFMGKSAAYSNRTVMIHFVFFVFLRGFSSFFFFFCPWVGGGSPVDREEQCKCCNSLLSAR